MKRRKLIHSVSAATLTASMVIAPISISADNHESTSESEETKVVVKEETTLEEKLFNYYGKVTDQLSLALEEEDNERVGLILDWSLQQIEEAELLYQQGLEDEANVLLEEALYILENAETDEEDSSEENEETNETEEETEDSTNEEETNEDETNEDETTEDEVVEEDDEEEEETEEETEEDAVVGQNVISLALAMEKVKNPNAQSALKRNIERSLDRLEAKYGEEELTALYERLNGITDEFAQEDSEDKAEEEPTNEEQNEEETTTEEPTEEPQEVEEPTEEDEVVEEEVDEVQVEEEVDEVQVEEDREENFEVKSSDQKSKGKSDFGKQKAEEAKNKASEKGNKGKGPKNKGKGNGKGPNN